VIMSSFIINSSLNVRSNGQWYYVKVSKNQLESSLGSL
jgi:hypothetical protein